MPHAESWPESLWWYVLRPGESPADRQKVINTYLERYARGAKVPEGFRDELIACLQDLSRVHPLNKWGKPRTKCYWTIPNYARAHGIHPPTLMKRLRELERIAIELLPARAAVWRRRSLKREPILEDELAAIKKAFWKGVDISRIADKHRLSPAHVGKLLEADQELKTAVRALDTSAEAEAPTAGFDSEEGF